MPSNRNNEGIILRAARFCWKALTIFLAVQSATAPMASAAPLRGIMRNSRGSTRLVDGILRAESGDLCAQGTLDRPVPCNIQVGRNLVEKLDRDGGLIKVVNVEIAENDQICLSGDVAIYTTVHQFLDPKDKAGDGWTMKTGYCFPREKLKAPIEQEIQATEQNPIEFGNFFRR